MSDDDRARGTGPTGPDPLPTIMPPLVEREAALGAGQRVADLRDEVADLRQAAADLREEIAALGHESARVKAEFEAVAAVRAQATPETAERTAVPMAYVAAHDVLTGLPNRALVADRLDRAIARAQRYGTKVALMCLDLDRFNDVNDSLGNPVGDRLLQSVANRLLACVRQCDTVGRQGGDEFAVLLSEVAAATDAELAAQRLMEAMAAPYLIDGHRLALTLSIGIGLYPDDGKDARALVKNADIAMYCAKNSGRNRYHRFTSNMNV